MTADPTLPADLAAAVGPDIVIDTIGGNCPVQAEGTINGKPFYFRARGNRWSLGIGSDPVGAPDYEITEGYGNEPYAAGWMDENEARAFIAYGAVQYIASLRARGHE